MIDLDDPVALLLAASTAFRKARIDAAAYGGLTLGMYGEVRETRDADLAVASVDPDAARDGLAEIGVTVVLAFANVTFGGNEITRLSLVGGGQLNMVDLVAPRSARYASAMLSRVLEGALRQSPIRVVSPEDFVLLKVLSTRERDLEDAASVVEKQRARLDFELLERERDLLAIEIPDHDVRGRFAAVIR